MLTTYPTIYQTTIFMPQSTNMRKVFNLRMTTRCYSHTVKQHLLPFLHSTPIIVSRIRDAEPQLQPLVRHFGNLHEPVPRQNLHAKPLGCLHQTVYNAMRILRLRKHTLVFLNH